MILDVIHCFFCLGSTLHKLMFTLFIYFSNNYISTSNNQLHCPRLCHRPIRYNRHKSSNQRKQLQQRKSSRKSTHKFSASPSPSTQHPCTCAFIAAASTDSILEHDWILDSGASSHMTPHYSDCFNITHTKASIKLADGTHTNCTHQGEATIQFTDDLGIKQLLHLQKVLIVPDLDKRLFSVTQFSNVHGNKITFSIHGVLLQFPTGTTLTLPPPQLVSTACLIRTSKPSKININTLHNRLGHRSIHGILTASDHNVWADVVAQPDIINKCISCPIASHKMSTRSKKNVTPPETPLHTIYLDTVHYPRPKGITATS